MKPWTCMFFGGLMVKDLALSLLWCRFDAWPRNSHMSWPWPKKKKKKKKKKMRKKKSPKTNTRNKQIKVTQMKNQQRRLEHPDSR